MYKLEIVVLSTGITGKGEICKIKIFLIQEEYA